MTRLIDADALNLEYEVDMADDWKTAHEIANIVKYAPTVDAVQVIRCKDCKHYAILEDGSNELICDHKDGCMTPKPDGFCNYAEPKRKTKL